MKYLILFVLLLGSTFHVAAHHVNPDRPTYLAASGGQPDGIRVQDHAGVLFIRMIAYPAHPKPGESVRIELLVLEREGETPFKGSVDFSRESVRTPFRSTTSLGSASAVNGQFGQEFTFDQDGFYLLSARFKHLNEPYRIDLPTRCGNPFPVWPIMLAVGFVVLVLSVVTLLKRHNKADSHKDEY